MSNITGRTAVQILVYADLNLLEDDDFATDEGKIKFNDELYYRARDVLKNLCNGNRGDYLKNLDFELAYNDEGKYEFTPLEKIMVTGDIETIVKDAEFGDVYCHSKVAGTTFREKDDGPLPWSEFQPGDMLQFEREPDNPHGAEAIKIIYGLELPDEVKRVHIGYVPAHTAHAISDIIDTNQGRFYAKISEVTGGTEDKPNRGINIIIYWRRICVNCGYEWAIHPAEDEPANGLYSMPCPKCNDGEPKNDEPPMPGYNPTEDMDAESRGLE